MVRLCFGRVKPGPTPVRSLTGAPVDSVRSRNVVAMAGECALGGIGDMVVEQGGRLQNRGRPFTNRMLGS